MQIQFFRYTGEKNRINKLPYLNEIVTHEGTLKRDCSMENPVVLFQGTVSSFINDNSNYINYCYIYTMGRFYFVTDIISVRGDLTEVHLHVDVLYSFKDSLLANRAIIQRSASDYSMLIDDGQFQAYQNQNEGCIIFPTGFGGKGSDYSYILITAGNYTDSSS